MRKNLVAMVCGFLVACAFLMLLSSGGCTSRYKKVAESAYDKFTHGDFDSMTPEERAIMDSFLESLG